MNRRSLPWGGIEAFVVSHLGSFKAAADRLGLSAPAFSRGIQSLATERMSPDRGRRSLRIGVSQSFAIAWLLPRLGRFQARHPQIDELAGQRCSSRCTRRSSGARGRRRKAVTGLSTTSARTSTACR